MTRKASCSLAAAFAGAALVLTAGSGAYARSNDAGSSPRMVRSSVEASWRSGGYRGWGWGYGRGWCYWHPYACYR